MCWGGLCDLADPDPVVHLLRCVRALRAPTFPLTASSWRPVRITANDESCEGQRHTAASERDRLEDVLEPSSRRVAPPRPHTHEQHKANSLLGGGAPFSVDAGDRPASISFLSSRCTLAPSGLPQPPGLLRADEGRCCIGALGPARLSASARLPPAPAAQHHRCGIVSGNCREPLEHRRDGNSESKRLRLHCARSCPSSA